MADLTFDSLGGIDSSFEGAVTSTKSSTHTAPGRRVAFSTTVGRATVVYQGPYDELLKLQKSLAVGSKDDGNCGLDKGGSDTSGTDFGEPRVSASELVNGRGNVATLTMQYSQNYHRCQWSIDFVEVSKPIITWHADKPAETRPDLDKIRKWQKLETSNPEKYWQFKIPGSNNQDETLQDDTLTLAEMISKGIENYPRYAPALTCTLTVDSAPDIGRFPVGQVGDPECPYGWDDVGGRTVDDILNGLSNPETGNPYKWVRTASRATPNSDGTFQWVMSWQGADSIEEKLYL